MAMFLRFALPALPLLLDVFSPTLFYKALGVFSSVDPYFWQLPSIPIAPFWLIWKNLASDVVFKEVPALFLVSEF